MHHFKAFALAAISSALAPNSGFSKDSKPKLVLGASAEAHLVKKDGSGIYRDVIEAVLGDHYQIEIKVGPWSRMEKLLEKGKLDGFAGNNLYGYTQEERATLLHPKWPLEFAPVEAGFLKKKYKKWDDDLLKTARLVWRNGYGLHSYIPHKVAYKEVSSDAAGVGMLVKDRADIFLSYGEILEAEFSAFPDVDFVLATTSIVEELHLVLRRTPTNEKIAALWDERNDDTATQQEITEIWMESPLDERFVSRDFIRQLPRQKASGSLAQISGVYGDGKLFTAMQIKEDRTATGYYVYLWNDELITGVINGQYQTKTGTVVGTWCEEMAEGEHGPIESFFYRKGNETLMDSIYVTVTDPGEWYLDDFGERRSKAIPKDLFKKMRKDVDPDCLKRS